MKSLHLLIACPALLLTLFSCQKKSEPPIDDSPYWGFATALKNGQPWHAEPYAFVNINHGNGLNVGITVLDNHGLRREKIELSKVPFAPATSPVINTPPQIDDDKVGAVFLYLDEDVILGYYEILEADSSSFVTLISYDTLSKEVRGTFDLTFIAVHKPTPDAPDTLRLRDGVFHTRVIK